MVTVVKWRPGLVASTPLWVQTFGRDTPPRLSAHAELNDRLRRRSSEFSERKLPIPGPGDRRWLAEGVGLLAEVRRVVGDSQQVPATDRGGPTIRTLMLASSADHARFLSPASPGRP